MAPQFLLSLFLFEAFLLAQQDIGRVLPANRSVHLVALGDFGSGSPHQAAVADAIARMNTRERFDLGITMGDNFYQCGVRSLQDPKWKTRWEDLYSRLGIHFYASLGNHDYGHPPVICPAERGSPEVEIAYSSHSESWRMPARYYAFTAGPVLFIAIDTEGWSGAELEWIGKILKASAHDSDIKWRIVYGHHPMFTSGVHLNERRISVLRAQLFPVLKDANVDVYICGHDHDIEHLRKDGMDFLICGSGGAQLRHFWRKEPISVFEAVQYGFLDLTIDARRLSAQFFNTNLDPLEDPIPTRAR